MAQKRGIHNILNIPFIYIFIQNIFAHKKTKNFWNKMIGNIKDKNILDVGCGPGKDSLSFKGANYIGIDISKEYIDEAKNKYSSFGKFYHLSIEEIESLQFSEFDIIILKGVIHHLNDNQLLDFLEKVQNKLSSQAKILTSDPVFTKKQNFISKKLISLDRGKNVRFDHEYDQLIEGSNFKIKSSTLIKQNFPPYQRYLMEIVSK